VQLERVKIKIYDCFTSKRETHSVFLLNESDKNSVLLALLLLAQLAMMPAIGKVNDKSNG
jgi:hypothetical protein